MGKNSVYTFFYPHKLGSWHCRKGIARREPKGVSKAWSSEQGLFLTGYKTNTIFNPNLSETN